jgi:hypothetical protein
VVWEPGFWLGNGADSPCSGDKGKEGVDGSQAQVAGSHAGVGGEGQHARARGSVREGRGSTMGMHEELFSGMAKREEGATAGRARGIKRTMSNAGAIGNDERTLYGRGLGCWTRTRIVM